MLKFFVVIPVVLTALGLGAYMAIEVWQDYRKESENQKLEELNKKKEEENKKKEEEKETALKKAVQEKAEKYLAARKERELKAPWYLMMPQLPPDFVDDMMFIIEVEKKEAARKMEEEKAKEAERKRKEVEEKEAEYLKGKKRIELVQKIEVAKATKDVELKKITDEGEKETRELKSKILSLEAKYPNKRLVPFSAQAEWERLNKELQEKEREFSLVLAKTKAKLEAEIKLMELELTKLKQ